MTGYQPGPGEFATLARDHQVVPVWREVLADRYTPLAVYERLRDQPGPRFLLESVEQGQRWGRYSFIGLNPFLELIATDGRVVLRGEAPPEAVEAAATGDPLATLDVLLRVLNTPQLPDLRLHAGAVGYLGYDAVRWVEQLPDANPDDLGLPDVHLAFPGQLIAFDHLRQRLSVIANARPGDDPSEAYEAAMAQTEDLVAALARPTAAPPQEPPKAERVTDAVTNVSAEGFMANVAAAKEHIAAGDAFQVVPSQRFSLETDVDPLAVYRVLRVINPSPYMYLFELTEADAAGAGGVAVVGSSPEALVKVSDDDGTRRAEIWPIAGSRPRGQSVEEDAANEAELRIDDKERAEHVMLVDLARNDVGRIAELGTVRVTELMEVVRYSHVMHLVSKVSGVVRDGLSCVDVLRATFPAGTLSGAPKVRAMEIIDDLETTRRGVYAGGIGYLDLAGRMDLCIAIRTVVLTGGWAHVQAGAGIVADSVPQTELEESRTKAMALLSAVRAAETMTGEGRDG